MVSMIKPPKMQRMVSLRKRAMFWLGVFTALTQLYMGHVG